MTESSLAGASCELISKIEDDFLFTKKKLQNLFYSRQNSEDKLKRTWVSSKFWKSSKAVQISPPVRKRQAEKEAIARIEDHQHASRFPMRANRSRRVHSIIGNVHDRSRFGLFLSACMSLRFFLVTFSRGFSSTPLPPPQSSPFYDGGKVARPSCGPFLSQYPRNEMPVRRDARYARKCMIYQREFCTRHA